MKNPIHATFLAAILFVSCSNNSGDMKTDVPGAQQAASVAETEKQPIKGKYTVKSGIIHSRIILPRNLGQTTTTTWFADYGNLEYTDSISETNYAGIKNSSTGYSITRDGYLYSWDASKTMGSKIHLKSNSDLTKIDYRELSEEMKKAFNITEEGTEDFMGKSCTVYISDMQGMKTRVLVWNNIVMKSESDAAGMKTVTEVTKLEEGVQVPAEKFTLPAGITFNEISLPGK